MNWIKNLWESGSLGTLETDVSVETKSIVTIAVTLVIVAIIIILFHKFSKKL
jgi:hypothetical protein